MSTNGNNGGVSTGVGEIYSTVTVPVPGTVTTIAANSGVGEIYSPLPVASTVASSGSVIPMQMGGMLVQSIDHTPAVGSSSSGSGSGSGSNNVGGSNSEIGRAHV